MAKRPKILQPQEAYVIEYPEAVEAAEEQQHIFWTATEIEVEKDLHDMKTNFTEAETHAVTSVLKLFTKYETFVGDEYWTNVVGKKFKRPDIQRMANCFAFFELNVHAPFYNKLNEVLGLNTEEFYNSYIEDPTLKARMDWLDKECNPKNLPKSLAVFSMIEGAVLYSSFAFLKHFQAEGKNKLVNVCSGINFSVRDENLHSEAGAWLYRTLIKEMGMDGKELKELHDAIIAAAYQVYEHECRIIDMLFEKGTIRGITDHQLKMFVQSRIDLCLQQLNIEPIFKPTYNPIAKWFYKNINGSKFHDFFNRNGSEYHRDWNEKRFSWKDLVSKKVHPAGI